MIFETHAHYNDKKFDVDRDELLERLPKEGIKYVINIADSVDASRKSIELSERYDYIYAACGVHPENVAEVNEQTLNQLKILAENKKVVAIGEIGLDYHYDGFDKELQKQVFSKQVDMAKELNLPIIVHDRDAHMDTLNELRRASKMGITGVLHCYSGSLEMAKEVIKLGFYISVGGIVTFKNARKLPEVVEWIPNERLLLETDSPYLAPEPFRGSRNDSTLLKYIADKISEIKGIEYEKLCKITTENACRLFLQGQCD